MCATMSELKDKPTTKHRSKGEQTRHQILTAAIAVLVEQGIKGTTHRAIASKANLQLSLTTYYFKDIQELVHEAFMLSSHKTISQAGAAWFAAFDLLDSYTKTQLKKVSLRKELALILTDMATRYLINKIKENRTELIIEQLLFTEIQTTPQLRELALHHRKTLLAPFIKLCGYFNKENATLDADLMFTIFTQLEYRNLLIEPHLIDESYIQQAIQRIISLIIK